MRPRPLSSSIDVNAKGAIRMHKTERPLFPRIPNWLVQLQQAQRKVHGALIFTAGCTERKAALRYLEEPAAQKGV